MTQIAISPAPQPAPPAQTNQAVNTSNGEGQDFGTTLDQTIQEQNGNPQAGSEDNNLHAKQQPQDSQAEPEPRDTETEQNDEQPAGLASSLPHNEDRMQGADATQNNNTEKLALPTTQTRNVLQTEQVIQPEGTKQSVQGPLQPNQKVAVETQPTVQNNLPVQPETSDKNNQDIKPETTTQDIKTSILAKKLDQLITNSNQKGIASIRAEVVNADTTKTTGTPANSPALSITSEQVVSQSSLSTASMDNKTLLNSDQNSLSRVAQMRMDAAAQATQDVKVDPAFTGNQNNQQTFSENNGAQNQQITSLGSQQTAISGTEQNQNFSSILSNQSPEATQTASATRPAFTMAHPHVSENQVMDQLIQRFNVNPRLQTSKLTMQLNPAELGELKIDVLVKGDSIKANVVAQSQQVQEIIERNMVRLRSVLEDQGFSVDELIVTTSEDGSDAFNMFQQSFTDSNQSSGSKRGKEAAEFELPLEELVAGTIQEEATGVNVKI